MTDIEKDEIRSMIREEISNALKSKSNRGHATCLRYGRSQMSIWGKLGGRGNTKEKRLKNEQS